MTTISNKVRYYHSAMPGAPALSGAAGALIGVLDACLVDGFDSKAIDSLTITSSIAVAQISAGHSYGEGDVLRISGATPVGLNSDWRLASVTASTVTFSVAGVGIPDGSATGTMTALRAPAGWEKVFADGTTRAAYRSLDYAGHAGRVLYVNDVDTTMARVQGFAEMTDIDTGIAPFPTTTQVSGGLYWQKANSTTGVRRWWLAADSRRLVFVPAWTTSTPEDPTSLYFGLLADVPSSDSGGTILTGPKTLSEATAVPYMTGVANGVLAHSTGDPAVAGYAVAGGGGGGSAPVRVLGRGIGNSGSSSYPPPPVSGVIYVENPLITDQAPAHLRGRLVGPAHVFRDLDAGEYPAGKVIGSPGNGLAVFVVNSAFTPNFWALDLGTNGRWD